MDSVGTMAIVAVVTILGAGAVAFVAGFVGFFLAVLFSAGWGAAKRTVGWRD